MKNTISSLFVALSLLAGAARSSAQPVAGTVQGLVVDSTGGVVAGAQVILTNEDTSARLSVRTDDRGWFVITPVDPGAYRLEVTQTGFRRHVQSFTLQVNQRLRRDFVLQTGPVTAGL